jgi:hypothetical protein
LAFFKMTQIGIKSHKKSIKTKKSPNAYLARQSKK